MLVAASRKKLEGMASNLRKMAEAEAMQLNRAIDNLSAAAGTPAADEVRPPVLLSLEIASLCPRSLYATCKASGGFAAQDERPATGKKKGKAKKKRKGRPGTR